MADETSLLTLCIDAIDDTLESVDEVEKMETAVRERDMSKAIHILSIVLNRVINEFMDQVMNQVKFYQAILQLPVETINKRLVLGRLYERVFYIAKLGSKWDKRLDPVVVEVFKDNILWERIHGWGEDWPCTDYMHVMNIRDEWLQHHKFLRRGIRQYQRYVCRCIILEDINDNEADNDDEDDDDEDNNDVPVSQSKKAGLPEYCPRKPNDVEEAQRKLQKALEFFDAKPDRALESSDAQPDRALESSDAQSECAFRYRCRLFGLLMKEASKLDDKIGKVLDKDKSAHQEGIRQPHTELVEFLFLLDKLMMARIKNTRFRVPILNTNKTVLNHLLVHAAQSYHMEIIWWVIDNCDVLVPREAWIDALCVAVFEKNSVVRTLLKKRKWKRSKVLFHDGETNPLHVAIKLGHLSMVQFLCGDKTSGIPAYLRDEKKRTARDLAFMTEDQDIQAILLGLPDVQKEVERLHRDRQVYVDATNVMLVGAAVIAGVTFSGWMQPPLGFSDYYQFPEPHPAPPGTYQSYASFEGHLALQVFAVFNSLSFFFAITTVLAGADAAFPVELFPRTSIDIYDVRRSENLSERLHTSVRLTTILFVTSILFGLGAFASAGFAILPPGMKFNWIMISTFSVGGLACMTVLVKLVIKRAFPKWVLKRRNNVQRRFKGLWHCGNKNDCEDELFLYR